MSTELVTKGVSFNVADPDQLNLLEHAQKRPNFSGYIKRLIQRDMEGLKSVTEVKFVDFEEDTEDKADLMSSLI